MICKVKERNGLRVKRSFCLIIVLCIVLVIFGACDENVFSESLDERLFEYILRDTEKEDVVVFALDAYSREGWCYYHIKYSLAKDGERNNWDVVYRGRYADISLYYNLNWEDDSVVFPMKDGFYDAVEYGVHKSYTEEEIARYIDEYYKLH